MVRRTLQISGIRIKRGVLKPGESGIAGGKAFVGPAVFAEYFFTACSTTVACGAVMLFHALHGFAAARKSEKLNACFLKRYYRFPG
jgi:hypothetical protein